MNHSRTLRLLTLALGLGLLVAGTVLAADPATRRRELEAEIRELRESIRLLESARNQLRYTGDDLRRRHELGDLITRKQSELRAVQSLHAATDRSSSPATRERLERRVREAEQRATREEIRLLENRRNRLGTSGDDLRDRHELGDLLDRKRSTLRARQSTGYRDDPAAKRRLLEAEVRELREEIRLLERQRTGLGTGSDDLRRRHELGDLINRKRDLLRARERSLRDWR